MISDVCSLVRKGGLEPPHLSVPDPKSGASANSATFACDLRRKLYHSRSVTCNGPQIPIHDQTRANRRDHCSAKRWLYFRLERLRGVDRGVSDLITRFNRLYRCM